MNHLPGPYLKRPPFQQIPIRSDERPDRVLGLALLRPVKSGLETLHDG